MGSLSRMGATDLRTKVKKYTLSTGGIPKIAVACLFGVGIGVYGHPIVFAGSSYGQLISAKAVVASHVSYESASSVVNNAGMSGADGKAQTHDNQLADMWLTNPSPGNKNWITFDLGAVYPLGQMYIWNYNGKSSKSPAAQLWKFGLKDVRIFTSVDNRHWSEFKGSGYPFQLTHANGTDYESATNLNNGQHSPLDFRGLSVRYVKIVPNVKAGTGNWGNVPGWGTAFGLSAVRFYTFSPYVENHTLISATASAGSINSARTSAINLINNYGMSNSTSPLATHDNAADASDMWLSAVNPGEKNWVQFDLGGTYPLGEMHIWNYNQSSPNAKEPLWQRGLKNVSIYYSLDGTNWTELRTQGYPFQLAPANGSAHLSETNLDYGKHSPINFGGAEARYVKIVPNQGVGDGNWGGEVGGKSIFGLSAVRFYATTGYVVEPAPAWSSLFNRYSGWTGADGIFSIPLKQQAEPGSATSASKTLFLFSDTYIGSADPNTKLRSNDILVHNSLAMMTGNSPNPKSIQFIWNKDNYSIPISEFQPGSTTGNTSSNSWYWLQDGVTVNDTLYLFPILVEKNPSGPPGFQFKVAGVSEISIPIRNGKLDLARQRQYKTDLFYHPSGNSGDIIFGAGIMANTKGAGAPHPDGYIYVYGYKNEPSGEKSLVVARTLPQNMTSLQAWQFWNGQGWSTNPGDATPLLDGVSAELSVTPINSGQFQGKYEVVYEKDVTGNMIECSLGNSPVGPFQQTSPLYNTSEQIVGESVFTYNAKAHPALSPYGELLISYNVNSTDVNALSSDADIYYPRWLVYREIK